MGMNRMVHPRSIPPGAMNPYASEQFQQVTFNDVDLMSYFDFEWEVFVNLNIAFLVQTL